MATTTKQTETLKAARTRRGLSVSETARLAHLDRATVWRLETGRRIPTYPTVAALEAVLKTRLRFPTRRTA